MSSPKPVGRPDKYTTHVKPHLETIKTWRENGMKLEAIAKELGISRDSLNEYQKRYTDFADILTTAKEKLHDQILIKAEQSLFTLIEGREVEETTIEMGQSGDNEWSKTITKTRYIPPNPTAVIFALKNRDPDHWKDRTELDARHTHQVIPQPLAPVRGDDLIVPTIEGEVIDSTDNEIDDSI